jgi:hypothetical protein
VMRRTAPLAALAALACAVPATADQPSLPDVRSGHRPGPDALYLPPPRAPQLENAAPWRAEPILISGASAYRDGEFLYQDWLFDDRGAAGVRDPEDPHPSGHLFSPKRGTLTYPTDPAFASNAADLVELRVRPLRDETAFRVTLSSLHDPDRTAFTIAIGESEAAREWPHGAGVRSPAELFLTVHGTRAELRDAATGAPAGPAPRAAVDLERRQFDVRVPHAAWDPGARTVRLAAGVGLWDRDAGEYLAPGPTRSVDAPGGAAPNAAALFNVAFRAGEPLPIFGDGSGRTIGDAAVQAQRDARFWRERAQADALAAGDIGQFHANVDFGKLAERVDDESGVPATGYMNRIMASRYVFGQGLDWSRECGGLDARDRQRCDGLFAGQLQPYSIYVPEKPQPARGYGLTLLLHALSGNYNQYLGTRHGRQLGERGDGSIVITPAGRGPDGFYVDVAEADVFEVWADVARRYRLDPEWVAISGYSMGGIGTWRLASRYPDLFARGMPIVAGASTGGNMAFLPSLRNVPVMTWSATLDELQRVDDTEATTRRLGELGLRFVADRFETWDHLTPATRDDYGPGAEFLGTARVDRDPPHVSYVFDPRRDSQRADVVADHAYWLSGLRARDRGLATIDARSEGFGIAERRASGVVTSTGVLTGAAHDPSPYTRRAQDWQPQAEAPRADRLVVRATNAAAATIDGWRARVGCAPALDVTSDGPLDLRIECARVASRRACTPSVVLRLPRVRGRRVVSVTVTRGGRVVRRARGRNLRSVRVRRPTRRAFALRVAMRTRGARSGPARVVVLRRFGSCASSGA